MIQIKRSLFLLLITAGILSLLSLIFSLWVYTYDYNSKLAGHSSSEATVGVFVETSGATCGDNLCNGAESCSTCEEDCGVCSGTSAPSLGSGGGGGAVYSSPNFVISEDSFNLKIVSGESETKEIIIENIGSTALNLVVSVTGIENYIIFNTNYLSLNPSERVPLRFTINAPEPGVYAGKILLTYQGITREVLVLLNVISEGVLFDTTVTVPDLYRVLREGQRLPALIELLEIGGETGVDVTMNYIIKDFDGNIRYTESETFYVKGAKSYSKRFSTAGLEPGDYVLGVELIYIGGFATSTAHFKISDSLITPQTWFAIGVLVVALIVCILAILFFRHSGKQFKATMRKR
ncbi:hypothetical protein FJZ21_00850 [Candidatus Pacearchaeota archaeon]|nr:hypothetical protein [Candidatus Pacearchaeota archaeon]